MHFHYKSKDKLVRVSYTVENVVGIEENLPIDPITKFYNSHPVISGESVNTLL